MFEFSISKEQLLSPLLAVAGAVDKKQALPILSNLLLRLTPGFLQLTATDLEIEMTSRIPCQADLQQGEITVPAKKLIDIIRSLEDDAAPKLSCDGALVMIREGRSLFKLATLPAENFPSSEDEVSEIEFSLEKDALIRLLQSTHFAMSQQDVRIFLNGLLIELDPQMITTVGTDGHRMAICRHTCHSVNSHYRILLPKKGVQEILRLLNVISDHDVSISVGKNHLKLVSEQYTFLSKLIEARFPAYNKAIPKDQDKMVVVDRDVLRRALTRIMILANEKSKAVLLHIQLNQLTLVANNQEQEEAIEVLEAQTVGEEIKIGINATYLLDVLNHLQEGMLRMSMSHVDSSVLVESCTDAHYQYIIMPMKI